jgi:hypothetical protein
MKLVMKYAYGDFYTFSCDITLPIEAGSPEEATIEFEDLATEAYKKVMKESGWIHGKFIFCGREFSYDDFWFGDSLKDRVYCPPLFFTIDEWFSL